MGEEVGEASTEAVLSEPVMNYTTPMPHPALRPQHQMEQCFALS